MQQHDRINLFRLVRRLESPSPSPSTSETDPYGSWLRARSQQQKVAYARKIWKGLAADGEVSELNEMDKRIEQLERLANQLCEEHPAPVPPRTTFLESLPLSEPTLPQAVHFRASSTSTTDENDPCIPSPEIIPASVEDSLLPAAVLLPEFSFITTRSSKTEKASPEYTLNAVQSEITDQLGQLSHQLKLNALHFSEKLAADASVVGHAENVLEENLERIKRERGRLKEHSSKSGGTTWMTLGVVFAVMGVFMAMFFVIRIT